ncbi:UPF0565 protein C2orf69-like isoform X2 [Dinothrombium tinctorium]|uniref:UPF0565 protein C2orf69-like isoform X2 n=1 Tax=Dinothrombium tinctorium TaxID=1965070 RepID=A0A443RH28_9ACAR|nr:UPF0565 protein C2orf69-like isoform X2 [Dinothrombium tinctorium]RWS14594.1 UPF0565 protein C2orf69-like isoform X2 [Dinothrombium tinctorium]
MCSKYARIVRLIAMQAFDGKRNDLFYLPCKQETQKAVIYFGGDIQVQVQDYEENMVKSKANKNYIMWSLENTACTLHEKFIDHSIFIVRPSTINNETFSCYHNFVEGNKKGVPAHKYNLNCIRHLKSLMEASFQYLKEQNIIKKPYSSFILMGFSKGCVVLNQLLYSLDCLLQNKDESLLQFMNQISAIYWMDGGHSGSYNTWITDQSLIKNLTQFDIKVHIYVTPYQIRDEQRSWIGEEENTFFELLKQFNVPVKRHVLFDDRKPSLHLHFQLLNEFEP